MQIFKNEVNRHFWCSDDAFFLGVFAASFAVKQINLQRLTFHLHFSQHDTCSSLPSHCIHSEWGWRCGNIQVHSELWVLEQLCLLWTKDHQCLLKQVCSPSVSSLNFLISFNKRRKIYLLIIISISSVSTDRWNKRSPCFQLLLATTGGKPNCPFGSRTPQVEERHAQRFRNGGWNRSKACTIAQCPSN